MVYRLSEERRDRSTLHLHRDVPPTLPLFPPRSCKHLVSEFKEPIERLFITKSDHNHLQLGLGAFPPLRARICTEIVCKADGGSEGEGARDEL